MQLCCKQSVCFKERMSSDSFSKEVSESGPQDARDGSDIRRWDRAQKLVQNLGVKLHRFQPSKREVWTVVGKEGDFLVDYDPGDKGRSYCSCNDFHFRVLSGNVPVCYHLLATEMAYSQGQYAVVEFRDDEYEDFIRALVSDLFSHL